jgi:hypothetical protein
MPPTTQKQIRAVACDKLERIHDELEELERSKTIKSDTREIVKYLRRKLLEALALLRVQEYKS